MSVTFQVEQAETGLFTFSCIANQSEKYPAFASREEAAFAAEIHKSVCEDCVEYNYCYAQVQYDVDESVNLSNNNASMVMSLMGLSNEELWGSMDAENFLGYVLTALWEERDNSAVETLVMPKAKNDEGIEVGATIVYGGLSENYVEDKLVVLSNLATLAKSMGRKVVWG
jgi:hypothetical protein